MKKRTTSLKLAAILVFKIIELIRQSVTAMYSLKSLFFLLRKSSSSHAFFQIYCFFGEAAAGEIIVTNLVTNYDISFFVGMNLFKY